MCELRVIFIGSASAADLLDSRIPGSSRNRGWLPGGGLGGFATFAQSLEASRIAWRLAWPAWPGLAGLLACWQGFPHLWELGLGTFLH